MCTPIKTDKKTKRSVILKSSVCYHWQNIQKQIQQLLIQVKKEVYKKQGGNQIVEISDIIISYDFLYLSVNHDQKG